jgi:hypothetical protein
MRRSLVPLLRHKKKVWALGTVVAANVNTTVTNNMGADGYTWANAPAIKDSHNNIITITEDNSQIHRFTYLNASGSTWADSTLNEPSWTRGSMYLDDTNHLLHVLLTTTIANGGVVYRRYQVQYTGNNITDIVSDNGVTIGGSSTRTNVVLDDGVGLSTVEHPVLIGMPNENAMLAVWGAGASTKGEVRAAMVTFNTINDAKTLANWVAPVSSSTTTLGANTAPATGSYSALAVTTTMVSTHVPYLGIARQANKNLFLVYWDGVAYKWLRVTWNSGSSNWSGGLGSATTIYNVTRSGTDTGYGTKVQEGLKSQLTTAPSEDGAGNMYVGLASWNGNTNGDSWGGARIDAAGTLTTFEIHAWGGASNNGAPNLYPTGDLAIDGPTGTLIATYITQTDAKVQLYNRTTLATQGSAVQVFNAVSDIPLILRFRVGSSGNQIGIIERDAINTPTPPYHGRYTTVAMV